MAARQPGRDARALVQQHMARRIRQRRSELGLTQRQLAEALGVSQQALSKIEAGRMTITADILWQAAMLLGTSVDYYCEGLSSSAH